MNESGACILRKDGTVLLECAHPGFAEARTLLAGCAELLKSLPAYHTYRITPLSLWNAAAAGHGGEAILAGLRRIARFGVSPELEAQIRLQAGRYGRLRLHGAAADPAARITLQADHAALLDELEQQPALAALGLRRTGASAAEAPAQLRGQLKQELARLGYPVVDEAGYREGQALSVVWRGGSASGGPGAFALRDYQAEALRLFQGIGGSGVVVLPCGAGKTVVGLAVLEKLQCETLILTSSSTSVAQWRAELLARTELAPEEIGEYTGTSREVKPVTVATYQMLTHRSSKTGPFAHMRLFNERNWGLIIYDEVHLLPAPVFRATAEIQATRRLGLTATLVREDGREGDVFSLIGPKCYELPWKTLESAGWIAGVECTELTVPMDAALRGRYRTAGAKEQFRLASVNPAKTEAAARLVAAHPGAAVLVIGQYLDQLEQLAARLGAPLITGKTPHKTRVERFTDFNEGRLRVLVVSKVANFAVNLPDASVAIEVSGAFGSRQEEAQRLGRILRPKNGENKAYFYTLVSEDSREQEFALHRRLFLTEQGYDYKIEPAEPEKEATL
ncbi:DNA repair helicase XPB [Paenibacillus sp. NFR01]|uniref:DNA repair helicase XPB n=1 Tax=Paenibacillus sp. NFR01 TaxID=1566279 RepID=UPI0008AD2E08|nr:DNA repair helicase XPB [Paenibacillus sp. NFR01]SET47335.1 DNA excision repair protein ERCC-3 [Paenibacillus sp. NFR01]